ncbi:predicted protein [Phaeodactylum tricornutum CCAP 1055/1]|jgi:hypothetical protein|uniref:Uncharacterized protein n=1 Tax=Phaeodactylum tricornutum (strain CCAP 1055/1) TaxID=556484 RepID=B7S492_PHATC|nr:predicted protein [Phaeodactylum tricornutum CCAP 1055/1]EEC42645.1 predicted protein [Phaeodactylum tricornutum CCAP 1055/1]|eukprot:XP_002176409.1 predicted protein [Phaeodactylum tricornutum CCAP 1055/1]
MSSVHIRFIAVLLWWSCLVTLSDAFLLFPKPITNLVDMAKSIQQQKSLDVVLDFFGDSSQRDSSTPRLSLQGLRLKLGDSLVQARRIRMPGFHGPHPSLSSGIRDLSIQARGFFTDMLGRQEVDMRDGAWELVWKDGSAAGSLICGLDVPDRGVSRNGVAMPSGRLYLTFPVFTHEGYASQQARKEASEKRADEFLQERDDALCEMQSTDNLLKKALLYRKAAEAVEKYSLTGIKQLRKMVPSGDDLVAIPNGLLLTTKGTIWTKALSGQKQILLGTAKLCQQTLSKLPATAT